MFLTTSPTPYKPQYIRHITLPAEINRGFIRAPLVGVNHRNAQAFCPAGATCIPRKIIFKIFHYLCRCVIFSICKYTTKNDTLFIFIFVYVYQ